MMKTLLFLSLLSLSLAWMPPSLHHQTLPALFAVASGGDNRKDDETPRDFPPDEELVDSYKGEIDWDAEWKKVVQKQNAAADRPGKDFYKSEAQIAAIRAANKASRNIDNTVKDLPSLPSWRSLKGDWKFWIAVIALVSVGSSLLAAGSAPYTPSVSNSDSYYI